MHTVAKKVFNQVMKINNEEVAYDAFLWMIKIMFDTKKNEEGILFMR